MDEENQENVENTENIESTENLENTENVENIEKENNDIQEENEINEEKILEFILNKKREIAREYRKEGHLYFVTEDRGNVIYLWDYTDKPDFEVEEFELPEEIVKIAKEGTMLQYVNGKYEIYSSRGYDEVLPEEDKKDDNNEDEEK